jgi:RNA 2',3'-cyclic 3'-phosphodiesterase
MRLFIGIPLSTVTATDLTVAIDQLRSKTRERAPESLRWSAPESWHITLQFLGSTTPQQYECVIAHLRELHHARIPIELGTVDTFDRAGVLFADVRVTPELLTLQQAITVATAPCGFKPEARPYRPHITLARRKGKTGDKQFHNFKLQINPPLHLSSFLADSFILYESIPNPGGSRYEVRERFMLSALK